jgi:hypothetical protein
MPGVVEIKPYSKDGYVGFTQAWREAGLRSGST